MIVVLKTVTFAVIATFGVFASYDIEKTSSAFIPQNYVLEQHSTIINKDLPPYNLDIVDLAEFYGYRIETHIVTTSDGYILEIHRMTGSNKQPVIKGKPVVLLQHGIISSSIDWMLIGPEKGLAFLLSDAGYDVWLGNARGNKYCRSHKYLSNKNKKFWDFSWHEIGTRDIPAIIDYILHESDQKKLFYIGHSQGTTVFFVMASEIPAYNDKIHAMFSLAPIAYSSRMTSPVLQYLSKQLKHLQLLAKLIGLHEFKPSNKLIKKFAHLICTDSAITQPICLNVLFLITGFNKDQLNSTIIPAVIHNGPAGASVKQFVHYAQLINSGHFEQFDFGSIGNMLHYGKTLPPSYNLKNIRTPVSLHYGRNDWLANPKDVQQLLLQLPNPVGKFLVPNKNFNHLDFLFAKDVKHLVYEKIMSLMLKYKN